MRQLPLADLDAASVDLGGTDFAAADEDVALAMLMSSSSATCLRVGKRSGMRRGSACVGDWVFNRPHAAGSASLSEMSVGINGRLRSASLSGLVHGVGIVSCE